MLYADDATTQIATTQTTASTFSSFLPLIAVIAVFYFLVIRPQQKRTRVHQDMMNNLKKGDEIVTNGGIIGTIVKINNDIITIEIAPDVKIQCKRSSIIDMHNHAETTNKTNKKVTKHKKDDSEKHANKSSNTDINENQK
jgi:preprotein translocase subunit YajC